MMGFVAALSSSIAFIILIMSAQLLNMLNASISRDKVMASVHVEIQAKKLTTELKKKEMISYYLNEDDVNNLNFNRNIIITCNYGNNLSKDISENITVYNFLMIKKKKPNAHVTLLKPEYLPEKTNSCSISYRDK
ncbi:hypothetical protein AA148_16585 [Salmonella enterica subsp. enterica serovar Muenchen]|uniref:hypothetical protein n=2 Tax=Salmonella enterica TaxID=28901 RepID=UPI0008FC3D61|nr:hypothetical protein [Salmonella enterica]EAA7833542.1 hypothetical protein [Salmonella enterica subsp. enterica serovar Give]EAA8931104.1 hypothetical protein [Salmonella enterica subsp. enterica serovar Gaminara]EAA9480929.1 hypothetical protein [Salmonella enterica subsp. enterica]EAU5117768.1 hypothetical protein [Salmonella enterica subsp. enterica serovar Montevideo]EBL6309747.1 hypothetical protein [Salmonella enterica subsp. enterica serovar Rubislaw]ECE0527446.1 hypothetical prote